MFAQTMGSCLLETFQSHVSQKSPKSEGRAHLQVLGQSSWLQVESVLVGPQLPPLHFLIMKFKLHLCSRGDAHFGFEVLHIESSAPKDASPPT